MLYAEKKGVGLRGEWGGGGGGLVFFDWGWKKGGGLKGKENLENLLVPENIHTHDHYRIKNNARSVSRNKSTLHGGKNYHAYKRPKKKNYGGSRGSPPLFLSGHIDVTSGKLHSQPFVKLDKPVTYTRNNHRSSWICVWKKKINSGWEITLLSWRHRFQKAPFSKCFPSRLKRKAGVFKFIRFEESSRKAPFSWRFSMDGRN